MKLLASLLALAAGGWLCFDGARALVVGDYVTPKSGPYAGRLGPWAGLVEKAGLDPRGTFFKSFHVVLGLAWLGSLGCYWAAESLGRQCLFGCCIATLWYLPVGTLISVILLVMFFTALRA